MRPHLAPRRDGRRVPRRATSGRCARSARPRECGPARWLPGPSRSPAACAQSSGHSAVVKRSEPGRKRRSPIRPEPRSPWVPSSFGLRQFKVDFRQHTGRFAGERAQQLVLLGGQLHPVPVRRGWRRARFPRVSRLSLRGRGYSSRSQSRLCEFGSKLGGSAGMAVAGWRD